MSDTSSFARFAGVVLPLALFAAGCGGKGDGATGGGGAGQGGASATTTGRGSTGSSEGGGGHGGGGGSVQVTADFYVSPDGDDTWSGTLAEPNPGKSDGPFATIGQ